MWKNGSKIAQKVYVKEASRFEWMVKASSGRRVWILCLSTSWFLRSSSCENVSSFILLVVRRWDLYIVIYMFHIWNIEAEERNAKYISLIDIEAEERKAKYISLIDGRERTFQPQRVSSAPRQTGIPDPWSSARAGSPPYRGRGGSGGQLSSQVPQTNQLGTGLGTTSSPFDLP